MADTNYEAMRWAVIAHDLAAAIQQHDTLDECVTCWTAIARFEAALNERLPTAHSDGSEGGS